MLNRLQEILDGNRDPFCRALSRTTRFNLLDEDLSRPPAGAVSRGAMTAIRSAMGLVYALCAYILLHLGISRLLAAVLATAAILALHTWLTGGRENRLALGWFESLRPTGSGNASDKAVWQLQAMLSLLAPVLLILLHFHVNGCAVWLIPTMALGAAGGIEYAAGTQPGSRPKSVFSWILAAGISLLCMTIACGGRGFFNSLVISALLFLLTPWLKKIPGAPKGFASGALAAEIIVIVLTLLLSSVN